MCPITSHFGGWQRPERLHAIPAICGRFRRVWANASRRWPDGHVPGSHGSLPQRPLWWRHDNHAVRAGIAVRSPPTGSCPIHTARRGPCSLMMRLENRLHQNVCSGRMRLRRAVRILELDWRRYLKRLPIRSKSNRSWSRPSGTGACSLALRVRAQVSAREQTGTCLACESGSAADRPPPLSSSRGCRFVHRKHASADGAPRRLVVVRSASGGRVIRNSP
jgi:hypothetical protein